MPNQIIHVQEEIRRYCSELMEGVQQPKLTTGSEVSRQPINRLKSVYPTIDSLVGQDFFGAMCDVYFTKFCPSAERTAENGGYFDEFLSGFAPTKHLPFFSDLAQLEWAVFEILQVGKEEGLAQNQVAEMPNQPFDYRIQRSPLLRILELSHNVHHIWQMHQIDALDKVVMNEHKIDLLVWRKDSEILFAELDTSEKELFEYLRRIPTVWAFQEKYTEFEQQLSKLIQLKQVILTL